MAVAGQTIESAATGERITFVEVAADTGGERLVLDAVWPGPGRRAAEHVHPAMSERFDVRAGRACLRLDGVETELGPGEALTVPAGTRHLAWNPGPGEARLRLTFEPALRWEQFVERLFAGDDPAGLLREFAAEIVLAGPPALPG